MGRKKRLPKTNEKRTFAQPLVNGILGQLHRRRGAKTVLPSKAHAKISCQILFQNRSSAKIAKLLIDHLENLLPLMLPLKRLSIMAAIPYLTPVVGMGNFRLLPKPSKPLLAKSLRSRSRWWRHSITSLFEVYWD